jgi:hypothetical protein
MPSQIAFIDLASQRRHLGQVVEEAILQVLEHGTYVIGPRPPGLRPIALHSAAL